MAVVMTPADLRARLAGAGLSQRDLARAMGVADRTVRRWVAPTGADVPDHLVPDVLAALATAPADTWIFGDGDRTGGEYAVHLHRPRLIARLVDHDDPVDAASADTIGGLTISLGGGLVLCEIRWIDPPPDDAGCQALATSCRDALGLVAMETGR